MKWNWQCAEQEGWEYMNKISYKSTLTNNDNCEKIKPGMVLKL